MKIDWKQVSKCDGYRSMKAVVANEAKRNAKWNRKPNERYAKKFNWAINRAKHYAYKFLTLNNQIIHKNSLTLTMIIFLNEWEAKRDYCFLNYYQDGKFPKFHSNSLKNKRGKTGYFKMKEKPRWNTVRKKRGY